MTARHQADMLAYADDCLEPSRRAAFEALIRSEPGVGLQIDEWRRQNNAIRAAFAHFALEQKIRYSPTT